MEQGERVVALKNTLVSLACKVVTSSTTVDSLKWYKGGSVRDTGTSSAYDDVTNTLTSK